MSCAICKEKLPPENDYVACKGCQNGYHYMCVNVRESLWRKNSSEAKAGWRCSTCKVKTELDSKQAESEKTLDQNLIQLITTVIKQTIKEENKNVVTKLSEFQEAIEFYSNKFDEYATMINNITEENKSLKKKCEELSAKCGILDKQTTEMRKKMEEDRQYSRNRNLQIDGIPEVQGENLVETMKSIGERVGVKIETTDVEVVHRVNSKKGNRRPVIIQFSSRRIRDEYLNMCKSRRPNTSLLNKSMPSQPIYVNEHMTPYYRDLFYQARNKKKADGEEKLFKYVWFKNSKLFVRKTDLSSTTQVLCAEDLE